MTQGQYPFTGYVQGENIYGYELHDYSRSNPIHIGVVNKVHESVRADLAEAGAKAEAFYDILASHGLEPKPEPTPDEIIKAQSEQLAANSAAMAEMQTTVAALVAELQTVKGALSHEHREHGQRSAVERGESVHQKENAAPDGRADKRRDK